MSEEVFPAEAIPAVGNTLRVQSRTERIQGIRVRRDGQEITQERQAGRFLRGCRGSLMTALALGVLWALWLSSPGHHILSLPGIDLCMKACLLHSGVWRLAQGFILWKQLLVYLLYISLSRRRTISLHSRLVFIIWLWFLGVGRTS